MANWDQINNSHNRFRLLCDKENCSLSLANLTQGLLHITSIHNGQRHSFQLSDNDMKFIVSQYLNSLSLDEREKMLEFFENF